MSLSCFPLQTPLPCCSCLAISLQWGKIIKLQLFGNDDQCTLLKGCNFFSELKKGLYVQNHCVVVFWAFFFSPLALSASLINNYVSFCKPCFCFLGAPPCEWSMTGDSSAAIWFGRRQASDRTKPLLGGLCRKVSGCSLLAGLCFFSFCQLFLHCPSCCTSPAHSLVTTTTKKVCFLA